MPHLQKAADPYLYVSVRVSGDFLDLTDAKTRRCLGVKLDEVLIPTEQWDDDMKIGVWSATHHPS